MLAEDRALELLDPGAERRRKAPLPHRLPDFRDQRHELLGRRLQALQQAREAAPRREADVFREEREQAADQKPGHLLRLVVLGLQPPGEHGDPRGDLAGDLRRVAGRVEGERVEPERREPLADPGIAEVVETEAMASGVGKRRVDLPEPGEVGIQFERVADVDHEQERRVVVGQRPHVALRLAAGGDHRVVPAGRAANARAALAPGLGGGRIGHRERILGLAGHRLLRLADKGPLLVEVDVARRGLAVGVLERHRLVEHVAVHRLIGHARVGPRHAEQVAELGQKQLVVGPLRAGARAPAGDEGLVAYGSDG